MLKRIHRLLFLYFFRDFDKGTLDAGFEFTTLSPTANSKILCQAATFNMRGLRRDSFLVHASNRKILNLRKRYICYWISGKKDYEQIYDRTYHRRGRRYVHISRSVRSELAYDDEGLEKKAQNLVLRPRRYHEKFVRLLRF